MTKPRPNTPLMSALGCQSGYNIASSENLPPSICLAEDLVLEEEALKDIEIKNTPLPSPTLVTKYTALFFGCALFGLILLNLWII